VKKWIALLMLVGLASYQSQPALAQTTVQSWNFNVYLDDKPIGTHRFELRQQGELRELRSTARFDVKILFINAYSYVHDANESWRGDCLQSMTSSTDDNGKKLSVKATLQNNELSVINTAHRYMVSGCVMSFAYWNPLLLQQTRLLNAQTGEYDQVTIKLMGDESLQVRGVAQAAKHYRVTGTKLSIDLWYSSAGEWLALESTTESGRRLRYVLS
jgi:Family of unknown function (DUF6134)